MRIGRTGAACGIAGAFEWPVPTVATGFARYKAVVRAPYNAPMRNVRVRIAGPRSRLAGVAATPCGTPGVASGRGLVAVAVALAALSALPVVAIVGPASLPARVRRGRILPQPCSPATSATRWCWSSWRRRRRLRRHARPRGWSRNRRFPGDRLFEWALLLPLAMPAYVMAYAYTDWLEYAGPGADARCAQTFGWSRGDYWFPDIRSLPGAAAMFVADALPLRLPAGAHRVPRAAGVARRGGADAGPDARRAFWRVDLPLARPPIAGGIALALMETLADYGTVAYFAVDTFTTGIYRAWFSLGDRVAAAQLSRAAARVRRGARCCSSAGRGGAARVAGGTAPAQPARPPRPRLAGVARVARHGAVHGARRPRLRCCPCCCSLRLALATPGARRRPRFVELAWNSFRVAGIAALLAVVLRGRSSPTRCASRRAR